MAYDENGNWINVDHDSNYNEWRSLERRGADPNVIDSEHTGIYGQQASSQPFELRWGQEIINDNQAIQSGNPEKFETLYGKDPTEKVGVSIDEKLTSNGESLITRIENKSLDLSNNEDREMLLNSVLYGTKTGSDLIKRIDIIKDDSDALAYVLQTQRDLAVEEMKKEKDGYKAYDVDRKYQFIKTFVYLQEQGYDLTQLKFNKGNETIDIVQFLGDFSKACSEYSTQSILDTKINSPVIDSRHATSPMLIVNDYIRDQMEKSPERFVGEYNAYLETKKDSKFKLTKEEFFRGRYNVEFSMDTTKNFVDARNEQMKADVFERNKLMKDNSKNKLEDIDLDDNMGGYDDIAKESSGRSL